MSIKTRVLLSYLLMLLIPTVVVVGGGRLLQAYHGGERPNVVRVLGIRPLFAPVARDMSRIGRRINVELTTNPDRLADPSFLELQGSLRDGGGFVVRRGTRVIFTSDSLRNLETLPDFPPFGFVADGPPPSELENEEAEIIGQWDFYFTDGDTGSLFLIRKSDSLRPRRRGPGFYDTLRLAALFLVVGGNGLVTFLASRSMVRPLKGLEAAALRISRGDMETRLTPRDRNDEIGKVYAAFERMRIRLGDSLARQRRYEDDRKELIANISHDLRTPITAIKGYVEGLRDGVANSPEKRDRYLKTIHTKATVVDRLIEELSLFSTLELDQLQFDFRVTDLSVFLQEMVHEFRLVHGAEDVSRITIPDVPVPVRMDHTQMTRAIGNVLENAYRHADDPAVRVATTIMTAGNEAVVRISDNGPGIPRADLSRVFERFYRVDRARGSGGSGLGLAITRRIIESHDGHVTADSAPGVGTTITITLPIAQVSR